MDTLIRQTLAAIPLEGTKNYALNLLEHIEVSSQKITLIFKLPESFNAPNPSWENTIQKFLKQVTNSPIAITFHHHKSAFSKNIPGVKHIIAVASGKGGVGKSSLCLNLALASQQQGLRIGLLDTDIYGPSLPTLLGTSKKPDVTENKKIIPHSIFNIKVMSMGFLVPADAAIVWRGLMVQQATQQLLHDVAWDYDTHPLDILFIDLPPGTGDVQLTLAQKAKPDGAILITTPHTLALADVKRALQMFKKVNVPIVGCIENMHSFTCSACQHVEHLLSNDLIPNFCQTHNVPYLGNIPYDVSFAKASETSKPFVIEYKNHPIHQTFTHISTQIWKTLTHA